MPQYQGVWSLQQQMQALTSGQWATDPLFDYTTLLLQADDAANSAQNNTFLDSSTNAFAITRNGNTTQGTFSPFSATGWGNYFVEANNDYLTTNSSASFGISGDFTYEGWVYLTSTAFKRFIMPSSVSMNVDISQVSSGNMRLVFFDGTTVFNDDINTFPINTWVHVAVVRSGSASNNCAFYVNGVRGTRFTSNATNSTVSITIGRYSTNGFDGYISNLRFCKSAVYSGSSFAPPTSPLTTTSQGATNCVLLTCQSNRFVDNSATAATITPTGTPSVQAFSPFAPQFQYTASGTGGSGYFDGTTDYLSFQTGQTALTLGTGNFTIEVWFYPVTQVQSLPGPAIFSSTSSATLTNAILVQLQSSTTFDVYMGGSTIKSAITFVPNQWNHLVVQRSATSTMSIWINGASVSSVSTSSADISTNSWLLSAWTSSTHQFTGYMSSFRITKGGALYSGSTITLPTAPLTTTVSAGTVSGLLNFTNAGIYDGTMKNNLETVGNAQISTSVVKYGSGSMYFDGTSDYLLAADTSTGNFGSGDFTIEFWAYDLARSASGTVWISKWGNSASTGRCWVIGYVTSSTSLVFNISSDGSTQTSLMSASITPALNTWNHYAVTRSGSTYRLFLNGVQQASATSTATLYAPTKPLCVGANYEDVQSSLNNFSVNGYMDDVRLTRGIARYITNFTPPLVALPRQ
jgi:hypothetical protein